MEPSQNLHEAAARLHEPLLGYDVTDTRLARLIHRVDGSAHNLVSAAELDEGRRTPDSST